MTRPLEHGELVETADGWRVVVSIPDHWGGMACYRWRSGERCVIPELVDRAAERRLAHAPPPPPPPDPLDRYLVVRARP
jgi:hypothetical protein